MKRFVRCLSNAGGHLDETLSSIHCVLAVFGVHLKRERGLERVLLLNRRPASGCAFPRQTFLCWRRRALCADGALFSCPGAGIFLLGTSEFCAHTDRPQSICA